MTIEAILALLATLSASVDQVLANQTPPVDLQPIADAIGVIQAKLPPAP